ncbi:MAG: metal-dependent transcriptional regulator [Candidatus Eisenbacteria bacterium]
MLTARSADYLETIYVLSLANDTVGVSQVAAERSVTIPTARSAVVRLRGAGLVRQERYGKILLTESGRKRAESVYRTHRAMFRFLHEVLGVDPETADSEACRLEHGLSEDTRARLVEFLDRQCSDDECGCSGDGCGCSGDKDDPADKSEGR